MGCLYSTSRQAPNLHTEDTSISPTYPPVLILQPPMETNKPFQEGYFRRLHLLPLTRQDLVHGPSEFFKRKSLIPEHRYII